MSGGKRLPGKDREFLIECSKKLTQDTRPLLWIVTIGGLLLAFYAIHEDYTGALPWIGAMVGLPWAAHGAICAFYLSLCKSDHREGGITFEAAKAAGFIKKDNGMGYAEREGSINSPAI